MEKQEQSPKQSDAAIASELAVSAKQMLSEIEVLTASLKVKLDEAEAIHTSLVEATTGVQVRLLEVNAAAASILAASTKATDEQAVIAEKSAHIQSAQEHADKVRVELDKAITVASQQATEAEGQRTRAQTATDSVVELLAAVHAHKATSEADIKSISDAKDVAKAASVTTKALSDKAETIEERVAGYEARLAELENQSKLKLETITGLLPGATAAGLAHAFDDRRKTFLNPATRWQWLFVGSLTSLVFLALSGLWNVYHAGSPLGWDELARLWLARAPIAGALVWLALHASRESALAKRLEEDYGYKAAIAASFLGFQKQMADIGASAAEGSPLSKLCADTLSTIASPPGRIYDKHKLIVTPTGELASAAAKAVVSGSPAK